MISFVYLCCNIISGILLLLFPFCCLGITRSFSCIKLNVFIGVKFCKIIFTNCLLSHSLGHVKCTIHVRICYLRARKNASDRASNLKWESWKYCIVILFVNKMNGSSTVCQKYQSYFLSKAYKFLDILLPTRHIMRCVIWIVQKPRQYSLYGV